MKSYRGKEVDMTLLMEQNAKVLAAGNMRVNARGDLIGRNGKILKTREQLENEYVKASGGTKVKEKSVGFMEFQDKVLAKELAKDEKPENPLKETAIHNPNLSTDKKTTVKFTEATKSLDDLPVEDEFEITDDPAPKAATKKEVKK